MKLYSTLVHARVVAGEVWQGQHGRDVPNVQFGAVLSSLVARRGGPCMVAEQ